MSDNEDNIEDVEENGDDNDGGDEPDENLQENTYYGAKGQIEDNIDEAIEQFQLVLDLEEEKTKWGFKALKQLIKAYAKTAKYKALVDKYKILMTYLNTKDVSKNDSEKAINKILGLISNATDQQLLDNVYSLTLNVLKQQKNDKLWFSTKIKQAKLYSDLKDFKKLAQVLSELRQTCLLSDGTEDLKNKASQLLEIFSFEIQMFDEQGLNKNLLSLYNKCSNIMLGGAVVLNPRITGVIRECGGKLFMRDKHWKKANEDFFDAFKSYDEAGDIRRIRCLKYLVLSNMLSSSNINPFDSNEAKPYKTHAEIVAMNSLVLSYQNADIKTFEKILRDNKVSIAEDPFIKDYLPDLYKNIRTKVLLKLIKPYTRIQMKFVAKELNISVEQVEGLCIDLILDQLFDGRVDQIHEVIELGSSKNLFARYKAMGDWTKKLQDIHAGVINKVY